MVRKGKKKMSTFEMWMLVLVSVLVVGFVANQGGFLSTAQTGTGTSLKDKETSLSAGNCPTDGDTDMFIEVQNILNVSGAEEYDATVYVLDQDGGVVTTITDTTNPGTATTLTCGYKYSLAVISADGEGGDNSNVQTILAKPSQSDVAIANGIVSFTADRSRMDIKLGMEQHGVLTFKLYDNEDARFAYDSGDADNTVFEAEGVTFRDGDNATAFAVSAGGFLDLRVDIKGSNADQDFQDSYILIGVEAPVDKWAEPTVSYNGARLSDVKDSINNNEDIALNSYEYVYRIDGNIVDDKQNLEFFMDTLSGADPTADVEIDFFTSGNYLKTDGSGIEAGTHKDDSSHTVVYAVQDLTIDVS